MNDSTALTAVPNAEIVHGGGWKPSPLAEMADALFEERLIMAAKEQERVRRVQKAVMKVDVDYGTIPGTDKPTLLKPGAELFNKLAGMVPMFSPEAHHGDGESAPPIRYVVKCTLRRGSEDGPIAGEGVGSCNSWERKYRYRKAERVCPSCGQPCIIKGKAEYGGGWLCFEKKGGCKAKFQDGDEAIEGQIVGNVENPDQWDVENTILKMAKKRAFVDATLTTHALSGVFTQDVEDLPPSDPDKGSRPKGGARAKPVDDPDPVIPFGSTTKGQRMSEVPLEALRHVAEFLEERAADPARKQFAKSNADMARKARAMLEKRMAEEPLDDDEEPEDDELNGRD